MKSQLCETLQVMAECYDVVGSERVNTLDVQAKKLYQTFQKFAIKSCTFRIPLNL